VAERIVPGIAEAMRAHSLSITKRAMLSRGAAVIRGKTLITNLPGSPKGVRENLEYIITELDHGLDILAGEAGDCGGQ
jgi:molybdopterin biosynthesis enzyme MoaB